MSRLKKWRSLKILVLCVGQLLMACSGLAFELKDLPVQSAGRLKPFDTLAREVLTLTWGRETYKGRPATDIVLSWVVAPEVWINTAFVQVRHAGLREALQLENERIYYSPKELLVNSKLPLLIQDKNSKQQNREKLDPFFQAVLNLENQLSSFQGFHMGLGLNLVPPKQGSTWLSLSQLEEPYSSAFKNILAKYAKVITDSMAKNAKAKVAFDSSQLAPEVTAFVELVMKEHGPNYAPMKRIQAEVHYNKFHPFLYAWICYLLAALLFSAVVWGFVERLKVPAWLFLALAFGFHTYGFALRLFISQRAPVTNMYETVVWVAWGAVVISVLLYKFFRHRSLLPAASIVATFCLILCDLSSHVLDESIHPLEPVLRDNFWLVVHVLTITLSYAAFFVAFVLADVALFMFWKDERGFGANIKAITQSIYRCLQVGVVLLAAGTILGGVWADYSWGRFWGWDPKETWAFIALMGYLAILHGRLVGWLKDFGMAVSSLLAFSLVVMAWYGVNFVLGAGLHTYGFGAGGVEYVAGFIALHLLMVAFVMTVRHSRLKAEQT